MELGVKDAAAMAGASERAVQQAIEHGRLSAHRQVGRSIILDDLAVLAWIRSQGRGRMMSPRIAAASMDLLDGHGSNSLSSSELSRLRRRLRTMSPKEFAHSVGGLGGMVVRYGRIGAGALSGSRIELWEPDKGGADPREIVQVPNLEEFEWDNPVILNADGAVLAIERSVPLTEGRRLLDTYLLGDSRASQAAGYELERRLRLV